MTACIASLWNSVSKADAVRWTLLKNHESVAADKQINTLTIAEMAAGGRLSIQSTVLTSHSGDHKDITASEAEAVEAAEVVVAETWMAEPWVASAL